MARAWGYWTRGKLDVLRDYLDAFTTASGSVSERIYLDAFAGEVENYDRLTDEKIDGSARIALSIDSPPFTRLRFFETEKNASKLDAALRSDFPDRDFKVLGGDCNVRIPEALARLEYLSWAPTFAFVDPNGMEAEWRTLEALATFKKGQKTKVELFLLFAAPMFVRVLRIDGAAVRPKDEKAINAMFGSEDWRHTYKARVDGEIEPSEARYEYVDLMRWRLEKVLCYKWTHPLEVRNERGIPIYYMIFATDHEVGTKIMSHLYANAAAEFPAMREETRRIRQEIAERDSGVTSLFGDDDALLQAPVKRGERFYEHSPPSTPRFLKGDDAS